MRRNLIVTVSVGWVLILTRRRCFAVFRITFFWHSAEQYLRLAENDLLTWIVLPQEMHSIDPACVGLSYFVLHLTEQVCLLWSLEKVFPHWQQTLSRDLALHRSEQNGVDFDEPWNSFMQTRHVRGFGFGPRDLFRAKEQLREQYSVFLESFWT
jgi:hypothetical protein